jgi:hypothetical protein
VKVDFDVDRNDDGDDGHHHEDVMDDLKWVNKVSKLTCMERIRIAILVDTVAAFDAFVVFVLILVALAVGVINGTLRTIPRLFLLCDKGVTVLESVERLCNDVGKWRCCCCCCIDDDDTVVFSGIILTDGNVLRFLLLLVFGC